MTINALTDEMHRYMAALHGLELSSEELEAEHFEIDEIDSIYVAKMEGRVVGYASYSRGINEWAGPYLEIDHIAAAEDRRGMGIGKTLFDILMGKARSEGVNITTGTLHKNERALNFYTQLGFKPLTTGLVLDIQERIPRL